MIALVLVFLILVAVIGLLILVGTIAAAHILGWILLIGALAVIAFAAAYGRRGGRAWY
jgi:hypothetical protein